VNKLNTKHTNDRYTRNDYIVYLLIMQSPSSAETNTVVKSKPSASSRKKISTKDDEGEKITEKIEGGIIVRRYKGEKIEPQ
jgi:hypothetical protein